MPEHFGLYVVLSDPLTGYERCTVAAIAEGVRYVQLRMKGHPRAEVLDVARRLRALTRGTGTFLIVNDDVGVAIACDADGVHLGQGDMSLTEARRRWTATGKVFGLSTHDETQELDARESAPNYVGIGPVFPTPTKNPPDRVLGPERAAAIARASPLSTVAIGGIDARNLPWVLSLGIVNFAVVRAVCAQGDPRAVIAELQSIWRNHFSR